MFVSCSEISISVIVKYVQHCNYEGFSSAWVGHVKFFSAWENRKNFQVAVC